MVEMNGEKADGERVKSYDNLVDALRAIDGGDDPFHFLQYYFLQFCAFRPRRFRYFHGGFKNREKQCENLLKLKTSGDWLQLVASPTVGN